MMPVYLTLCVHTLAVVRSTRCNRSTDNPMVCTVCMLGHVRGEQAPNWLKDQVSNSYKNVSKDLQRHLRLHVTAVEIYTQTSSGITQCTQAPCYCSVLNPWQACCLPTSEPLPQLAFTMVSLERQDCSWQKPFHGIAHRCEMGEVSARRHLSRGGYTGF